MSPEEKGVYCVKGYGTIRFVETASAAFCPISGRHACVDCDVITKEEASRDKQVKTKESR